METIKVIFASVGVVCSAVILFYLFLLVWSRLERINLTWKMLIDSANESRDKARKLENQLDDLTCSHQCLHHSFQEHAKLTQPKKAKSK